MNSVKSSRWKYLFVAIPGLSFGLGTWQIQRRKEKIALIAHIEEQMHAEPIPLPTPVKPEMAQQLEYRRVTGRGEFLHDCEMLLMPRPCRQVPGHYGAHVITPFKLENSGQIIFVNRGFVPKQLYSRAARPESLSQGLQTVSGIVRKCEQDGTFVPQNQPERNEWFWLDLPHMAARHGGVPLAIDADEECTPKGGYPRGGQANIAIRNEHANYIATWYSLGLATAAMCVYLFKK